MTTEDFESIIRSKNWEELSTSERGHIKEIAPDEAAFRTAKQILLLAAKEPSEVPQLGRQIRYMPPARPARKKTTGIWYGAAAVLLALSIGVWWYSQQPETTLPAKTALKQAPAPLLPNTGPAPKPAAVKTPSAVAQHTTKQPSPKKATTQPGTPAMNERQGDATVFLATNEPALVDLVVEMY